MSEGGIDWNAIIFFTVTAVVTLGVDTLRRIINKWIDSMKFNEEEDEQSTG